MCSPSIDRMERVYTHIQQSLGIHWKIMISVENVGQRLMANATKFVKLIADFIGFIHLRRATH